MASNGDDDAVDDEKDQYGHPRVPYRGHYDKDHCIRRRKWAERFSTCSLKEVGNWWAEKGQ
jgi:hypothetical protein